MTTENQAQIGNEFSQAASEWQKMREYYGYSEIRAASKAALANLKTVAPQFGEPDDYFKTVRSRTHIDLFVPQSVLFYKPGEQHGEVYRMLSGWYMLPKETGGYEYLGRRWKSLEHAYQASKFFKTDLRIVDKIQKAHIPKVAKLTSGKYPEAIRSDWTDMREMAMLGATLAIADQFEPIHSLLESTGQAVLIEDSMQDATWGRGVDFEGGSGLGRTWMMTREIMRMGCQKEVQQHIEPLILS